MDKRLYDKYVIQVANHGSLTKAAAALGITQPALSSGLSSLEKEIGITIFNRKTTPVSFTEEGELYYEYLQRIEVLTDDLQKRIDGMRSDADKRLIIGAPVAYSDAMVADAMGKLLSEHPDYSVSIKSASLSELIEMASSGEINCFVSTSDLLPANFEKKLIKKEKLFLCVPPDTLANEKLKATPFDFSVLNGENFILLEKSLPLQKEIEQLLQTNGIKAKRRITVNQTSTAVNLAKRGLGICVASEDTLANAAGEDITVYPLNDSLYGRNIYIAYDKDLVMPAACKAFIEQVSTGE